ncbi:type II secretion system protein GspK [uncultured Tateyamaria sp.]|uniref:general secretion pathway protein GspK n=1 Tax=Tateyamaria sp. 1078 TaxID=3417464 RepID=UPI00262DBBCC|nr:type II secretion system protein GspK [uncultured Tateyamaria sp.]
MKRDREAGVSLLNVLAILAIGTGLVHVMLRDQDVALDRLDRSASLAQARALAQSGATSVAVALRRDFARAPDTDHLGEDWALSVQDRIALDFGAFEVSVSDVRGRFDLNALHPGAIAEQRVFVALLSALDLPEVLASQITQSVTQHGPLRHPDTLLQFGLARSDLDRLAPHVTATDVRAPLNLNTVTEPLMAAMFANPNAARGLVARRVARGFLDQSDLAALGVALPARAGFTSDAFDVKSVASVGPARAVLHRRLYRDTETGAVRSIAQP